MERTTYATVAELPAEEWEQLAALAEAEERTVSQQASLLLRRALRAEADRQAAPA